MPELSIVLPVYNEAKNIEPLFDELETVLNNIKRSYEIIAVDDGSQDDSYARLTERHKRNPKVSAVRLLRNFGQQAAIMAGLERAQGKYVICLDADLQNPPSQIPKLLPFLDKGHDAVYGWRKDRHDNAFRIFASKMVNKLFHFLTGTKVQDLGCGLKGFQREVVQRLLQARHQNRYIPAEVAWLGVQPVEVEVVHRERKAGKSRYTFLALWYLNFNLIASISSIPIHLVGGLGLILFLLGVLGGICTLLFGSSISLLAALFITLTGIQLCATALLCEYLSRIYIEVQQRPYFLVAEEIGTPEE